MSEKLGHDWLTAHVPHQGPMSLLDEVVHWDFGRLAARASGHRDARHPLRRHGMLPAVCAIEYGAQAVAAHGALLANGMPARGFLASVRGVSLRVDRLDDIEEPLEVEVQRLGGGAHGLLYAFRVSAAARVLAAGRLTIALQAAR
ncbi:MAG TPA: 3-hydroxylacyl-ACP dehydratase [Usitatibacter sp.]|jgi:predicted hotdog family 3-hydroxylacyl-ACP dehydratase|nr:3-hydroxylacyl-ACP dehydratase [Usitatibacter sp.]